MPDGKIESLYYELALRTEGMDAGKAKAAAMFKAIEVEAAKTGKSVDEVASAVGRSGGNTAPIRKLADSFRVAGANAEGAKLSLHAFMRPLEALAAESISANTQVASLASKLAMFGLGTGLTVGILGGIALIVNAYQTLTEGARKAKEATDRLIESLRQRVADSKLGPDPELTKQVQAQRDELMRLQSRQRLLTRFGRDPESDEMKQLAVDIKFARETLAQGEQALANLGKPLETVVIHARDFRAELEHQTAAINAFKAAIAGATPGSADDRALQLKALTDAAEKAGVPAAKIRDLADALRAAQDEGARDELTRLFRDTLSASTVTLVDDLTDKLNDLKKSLAEKGASQSFIDQVSAIQMAVIEATRAAEQAGIDAGVVNVDSPQNGIQKVKALLAIQDSLEQARGKVQVGTTAWKIYDEAIKGVIARIKQLQDAAAGVGTTTEDNAVQVATLAGNIANATNAAFGLASAFLGVNSNITKALGSIGQLASGVQNVAELASKKGGFGNLFSTGGGILSALPGIGQAIGGGLALASSLFGKSPEEQERLRALKENNAQLARLSERVGDLAKINVQGSDLGQFQQFFSNPAIQNLLNNPTARFAGQDSINRQIGAILSSMGITGQQFKDFAQQFGITVGTGSGGKFTIDDLQQLFKVLNQEGGELGDFADDFAGQMSKLDTEIKLFDLSKPAQQFEAMRKALSGIKGGAGALEDLLGSFDLSTSQGIEAARKAIQQMFEELQEASASELPALLGGLTGDEFRQALERISDIIDAQAESGGIAGTGGFNVDRTITEVTGNRLEALLSTQNIFQQQTAENTALIARLLGGSPTFQPILPPPVPAADSVGASTLTIENLTITVVGAVSDVPSAHRAGAVLGESFIDTVDRQLAGKRKRALRAKGLFK